jgi:hypothetical protein
VLEWPLLGAWFGVRWGLKKWKQKKWLKRMNLVESFASYVPIGMTIIVALAVLLMQGRVLAWETKLLADHEEGSRPPHADANNRYIDTGRWISKELPNAIIMCRNPWELLFYMGPSNKSVGLPCPCVRGDDGRWTKEDTSDEAAAKIFAIARYYHVTHMLADTIRPAMAPYFHGRKPGLKKVDGGPRDLYEIDWESAPKATVDELFISPPSATATSPAPATPAPPG